MQRKSLDGVWRAKGRLDVHRACLAAPGTEYLVYAPDGGVVQVDLSAAHVSLAGEWLDADTGIAQAVEVEGGAWRALAPPCDGSALLWLRRRE